MTTLPHWNQPAGAVVVLFLFGAPLVPGGARQDSVRGQPLRQAMVAQVRVMNARRKQV